MKKIIPALLFLMILAGPPRLFAQTPYRGSNAAVYRPLAARMARDGFGSRTNALIAAIKKESMEHNRLGYAAYEKKDYAAAEKEFLAALAIDENNMFARFNLACVLSLAYGNGKLQGSVYKTNAELHQAVAQHLQRAAFQDVHWIYKTFLDTDLDAVRSGLIRFNIYLPCPGDACLDQYYDLETDGTVGFATAFPDLSGLGDGPHPESRGKGWYTLIGDYVLIFVPGAQAALTQWYIDDQNVEAARDALDCFFLQRNAAGQIEQVIR